MLIDASMYNLNQKENPVLIRTIIRYQSYQYIVCDLVQSSGEKVYCKRMNSSHLVLARSDSVTMHRFSFFAEQVK